MSYTKATEKDRTKWSLSEFIAQRGNFTILQEVTTGNWYARFNNKGIWTHVHIENKIKRTPIHYILSHQDEYEVIADLQEYCLYRKGDIIDYSGIWKDLHPFEYENDDSKYTTHDYYMNNPDIFNGEIM